MQYDNYGRNVDSDKLIKDGERKQKVITTSKIVYGTTLYEQVYDVKGKTSKFLGWDK